MNLGECQVGKVGTFFECLHCGRAVATHSVGAKEESTSVTAGGKHHGVGGIAFKLAGNEVTHDNTACTAVDHNDVEHLTAVVALHGAFLNLAVKRRVCAKQELLAGLALGIESTAHLCAAERAVCQQAAVFACERHTLCHALVDNVARHFGQTVNVGFARAEVATLHRVVEQAVNRVTVVLIVLGCIDTALCGD